MIGRLWWARIRQDGAEAYEAFARDRSLSMLRERPGCRGVFMMRDAEVCLVLSLWADAASIDAFEKSPAYAETVEALRKLNVLQGDQEVELYDVHANDADDWPTT